MSSTDLAETTRANRAVIEDFARLFYTERDIPAAFGQYVREDYIQHNPGAADGRDAGITFLTPLFGGEGNSFEIQRIVVEGDLAAIHVRANIAGRGQLAVADFYRLEDGLIAEHWDAVQPVPQQAANDHPMF